MTALVQLYFQHLRPMRMPVFAVVVDKRYLVPHARLTAAWVHTKAWELLCERIQMFMHNERPDQRALLVADDSGKVENCALAMRHAHFLETATSARRRLDHIMDMPLFVRSELSEGVQLADLCAYPIHRAFRDGNLRYAQFAPVYEQLYRLDQEAVPAGLKIFPPVSPLRVLLSDENQSENEKGRSKTCPRI